MTNAWIERWRQGHIGWHEAEGNAGLKRHWRWTGRRVLVPLCGKSPDVVWLADRGNEVIGAELSEIAVEAFFAEQGLTFEKSGGRLPVYRAVDKPIAVYCGDFFEVANLRCDAHYDRGALIAMPADRRPAYAAQVDRLLQPGADRLVITLEYDDTMATGPPYSVTAEELGCYWPELVPLESRDDIDNGPPKFLEAGLERLLETVWATP